jgi:hypothetical protein
VSGVRHVTPALCAAAGIALAAACGVAGAAPPERVSAGSGTNARDAAYLPAINSFHVAANRRERLTRGPGGAPRITWEVDWRLSWTEVPGATGYAIFYGTNEGASDRPRAVQTQRTVTVQAAAGTSSRQRLRADQRAALVFTSSKLLVAVAPRAAGRSGPRSPWFPVGDLPPDGVPLGTARLGRG